MNQPPPVPMPTRGERNAPQFDSSKPRELLRYFSDLQFLFTRSNVTDVQEKKGHATRFLSVEDQEIWETLAEFSDATKTFEQFKAAVLKLYPGTDADRKYSVTDLDALIGQYGRIGIYSQTDFSEFYRQFIVISKYLVDKNRLSEGEKCRAFRRAIQPPKLWEAAHKRLQVKKPDVHPQDPYAIADMYEAVEFALADPSNSASESEPKTEVKQEVLLESIQELLKLLQLRLIFSSALKTVFKVWSENCMPFELELKPVQLLQQENQLSSQNSPFVPFKPPKPLQPNPVPPPLVRSAPPVQPPVRNIAANPPPEHPFAKARDAAYAPPKIVISLLLKLILLSQIRHVFPFSEEAVIEEDTVEEQKAKDDRMTEFLDSMPAPYANAVYSVPEVPPGAFVVDDPYEIFYGAGPLPDDLIVSLESSAIRSILPTIIAMSEGVCHELGLMYDPRIVLQMQSANGSINPSLGLSRNVLFLIGDITFTAVVSPEAPLGLEDDILDPDYAVPQVMPADIADAAPPPPPSTGDLSMIVDWELDSVLLRFRTHFRRAGISMIDGLLRQLGHRLQRDRIRESLCHIDPVHRVFQRIQIR
ncbi:hypothetical protein C8F04DRAFT_1267896 [Mycena alexandri]|uniref:Uncharacterized protein n=1 Tax=Mycena alexandri TaxID=1745969 RepID=A0AAD6SFJ7_9AGAR|nr:hypothetical protein C8F04DRAFT_1267896 [Mycena alexandri]